MLPIEIIALIFAILASIKILVILVKPKAWLDSVVKKVWVSPIITEVVSLVLAGIVLYYLLDSGIDIVEIFAVMAFVGLIAAVGVAAYAKEVVGLAGKIAKQGIVRKAWLQLIIWIVLVVWVLYALF